MQHYDNGTFYETQHNDIQHSDTLQNSMSCNIMMLSVTTLYETQHNAISFMTLSKMAFRKLALSMIFSIIGLSIATINMIINMLHSA
jgi:hypothetical protein